MDDFENVDPAQFSKRSKGLSSFFPNKEVYKSAIVLTTTPKAATPLTTTTTTPALPAPSAAAASPSSQPIASPRRSSLLGQHRHHHHHKSSSSVSKFGAVNKSSPLVPAGQSPPRSTKRSGLLTSRRRAGPYSRIDPPHASLAAAAAAAPAAPFSLDAALKGTIPSYAARSGKAVPPRPSPAAAWRARAGRVDDLSTGDPMKDSWFFDIHEDTPEQEMTNLLQHSTCVLDISSDEETESKRRREKDEGRDKENVPPADDVSQTSTRLRDAAVDENAMVLEEQKIEARVALREMDLRSFFPEGCDESSIFVVPGDEDAETVVDEGEAGEREQERESERETKDFVFAPEVAAAADVPLPEEGRDEELLGDEILADVPSVDELMKHSEVAVAPEAAVLQPVEGTQAGESFELWESGSAKDENEAPAC